MLNRCGWGLLLQQEEQRRQRYGPLASVLVLDVDALKTVDDLSGHAAGYLRWQEGHTSQRDDSRIVQLPRKDDQHEDLPRWAPPSRRARRAAARCRATSDARSRPDPSAGCGKTGHKVKISPAGGLPGCLVMIMLSIIVSVVLTVLLNLLR